MTQDTPIARCAAPKAPPSAKPIEGAAAEKELRRIAEQFESVFSKMLLAAMRKTIPQSSLFHAGRAGEIFSELLDSHYSEAMSRRSEGLGIAGMIVKKYAAHVSSQVSPRRPSIAIADSIGSRSTAQFPGTEDGLRRA